ncbi:MAG: hypothetical protein CEO22_168 [Candidatus Berkelbacteria bacterium Gr01-1014_85]|uniref:Large ribosomal subunit protein uL29 n=1 Tax=Candidatus Berkelbacteria bacterium Gr01-1014_85 TaxID=2017150 RepID=A0A554JD02_9BACT|nr:MAG: hypothetical protein CEO22_168 [Candidatus Berkelbacteria bacterium Gr01-1014_85]
MSKRSVELQELKAKNRQGLYLEVQTTKRQIEKLRLDLAFGRAKQTSQLKQLKVRLARAKTLIGQLANQEQNHG